MLPKIRLVFDVLHESLGAGIFELSLRDFPAPIFVDLREVDNKWRGGRPASNSPDGTALFQIASHCSGLSAAEGRPDVMVFACASTQVAVGGSTIREMMDALNIVSS